MTNHFWRKPFQCKVRYVVKVTTLVEQYFTGDETKEFCEKQVID